MELEKILEYQKIDMRVFKVEKEYNTKKEKELSAQYKKSIEEKKNLLISLAKELDATLSAIEKISEKLDALQTSEWDSFDFSSLDTEEKIAEAETKFDEYEKTVANLNKELTKALKKEEEIAYQNRILNEKLATAWEEYKKVNAYIEKKKNDMIALIKSDVIALKKLIPDLDKDLYEKYIERRKAKKMPPFVIYNEGNCGGCGMDVRIELQSKLVNNGDIAECPSCGRIIFLKK